MVRCKFLLFVFVIVLCSVSVFGISDSDITNYVTALWKFEGDASDELGSNSLDNIGSVTYTAGKIGFAANISTGGYLTNVTPITHENNFPFTYLCWVKVATLTGVYPTYYDSNSIDIYGFELRLQAIDGFNRFTVGDGSGYAEAYSTTGTTIQTWNLVGGRFNGTYVDSIVNTNIEGSQALATFSKSTAPLRMGIRTDGGATTQFVGAIDECIYINKSISSDELTYIYNSGNGRNFSLGINNELNVNWDVLSPSNNSVNSAFSLPYYFNLSGSPSNALSNCSFIWNNTLQETKTNLVLDTLYNFTINKNPILTENITAFINCSSNNSILANSSLKYVYWNLTDTSSISFGIETTTADGHSQNWIFALVNAVPAVSAVKNYSIQLFFGNDTLASQYDMVTNLNSTSYNFTGLANEVYYLNATVWNENNVSASVTSSNITLDTVQPAINIVYPTDSLHLKNNTAFQWNLSISDSNVYGFEVNCSLNGVTQHYFVKENINDTSYNYTNTTLFTVPGNYFCNVSASDDHTSNVFDKPASIDDKLFGLFKIDQSLLSEIEGYIGDIDFKVDNSDKDITTNIIRKIDRVSFEFVLGSKDEVKEVPISFVCPFNAYKRNSGYKEHWVCSNGVDGYWIDGNTLEGVESVESSYDPETKEISYLYRTKNDKLTMESIGGLNIASTSFNVTVDFWENVSFSAFNVWNGSNILSFNVTVSNSTFSNSSTTTTGNVTFNLANGTYSVIQLAPGYYFGNLSSSYTSGSTSNFRTGFWQSQLTVNVVEAISRVLVPNASIELNISSPLFTNDSLASTGSLVYYANNGSFSIFANKSTGELSTGSASGTLLPGESRSIDVNLSRIYNVTIKREDTDELFNFTESNTSTVEMSLSIICQDEDLVYNITTANFLLTDVSCDWTSSSNTNAGWFISTNFPEASESYYRYVYPNSSLSNVSIWMLENQNGDVSVENIVSITDLANNYDGGFVSAETQIPGLGYMEVIRQKVDLSKKVHLFLQKDNQYRFYLIDKDGNKRDSGYTVAAVQEITIVQPDIVIGARMYDLGEDIDFLFNASRDTKKLSFFYTDKSTGGFDRLEVRIFRLDSNSTKNYTEAANSPEYDTIPLDSITWYNRFNVNHTFNDLDMTQTLLLKIYLDHVNSTYDVNRTFIISVEDKSSLWPGFENYTNATKLITATGVSVGVVMIGTVSSMTYMLPIALILTDIFLWFGWFDAIDTPTLIPGFGMMKVWAALMSVFTVIMLLNRVRRDS